MGGGCVSANCRSRRSIAASPPSVRWSNWPTRSALCGGPYAEAAHIWPLGRPHNGPDELANLLCLCPNHHVLFDNGAFAIADGLELIGLPGRLAFVRGHNLSAEHLRFHRRLW